MGKGIYLGVGGKARKVKKMYVGVGVTHEDSKIVTYPVDETTLPVGAGVGADSPPFWNSSSSAYEFPNNVITERYSNPYYCVEIVGSAAKYYIPDADKTTYYTFNTAKRIAMKKITSINSIARKVKKAYIGVGGVARPCFSSGELSYYGTATPLSYETYRLSAASVGNYALFAGGRYNRVDAYNKSLVHSNPTNLPNYRGSMASATIGNYALFAGGVYTEEATYYSSVIAYNNSLARSSASNLPREMSQLAGTTVGGYALFGGGYFQLSGFNYVTAYNSSLAKTTATNLSRARHSLAATTIGNYALFGGGRTGAGEEEDANSRTDIVDAYTSSLVRSTPTVLNAPAQDLSATTMGDYALFAGGQNTSTSMVTAYNNSLARSSPSLLSRPRGYMGATSIGEYALFGGGRDGADAVNTVDVYDASLTRNTTTNLSVSRDQLAATSIGNYALFAGGYYGGLYSNVVDVYTID